jgi:hypothetical protein
MTSNYIFFLGFLSSSLLFLSVYVRYKKAGSVICITDPFYIMIIFYFLYYVVGQFSRIRLDSFSGDVYIFVAFMVLLSTLIMFLATLVFDARIITVSFSDKLRIHKESKRFIVAAFVCLLIGYLFWYLNYARLGDISSILSSSYNRIDRNSKLTEMLGNLPYTHFMFAGYSFFLTAYLLKGRTISKSVAMSLILILPLIIFYIVEGERTALLKYIIFSIFIASFIKRNGNVFLRKKIILIGILLFLVMAILGNVRSGVLTFIGTGDATQIKEQFETKGIKMILPKEFSAVNFTTNKFVNDVLNDEYDLQLGYSYFQSLPYLFPRSVYRALGMKKELTIADKFGEKVRIEINRSRKMGFGMSGIAEAFANFHFIGIMIFPVFLLSIISLWRHIMNNSNSMFIVFLMITLTPIFVTIHRSAFASTFSYIAYVSFISFLAYWFSFILLKILSVQDDKSNNKSNLKR